MFYYRVEGKYKHVDALIIAPKADFVDEIASRGVPTPYLLRFVIINNIRQCSIKIIPQINLL